MPGAGGGERLLVSLRKLRRERPEERSVLGAWERAGLTLCARPGLRERSGRALSPLAVSSLPPPSSSTAPPEPEPDSPGLDSL